MTRTIEETDHAGSAAFFDLDRTLIQGSATVQWALAAWRAKMLPGRPMARVAMKGIVFRLTGATDEKSQQAMEMALGLVQGASRTDMLELADDVVPALVSKVRPESKNLLDMHGDADRGRFIVSAAPAEIVEHLAEQLGLEGGIGTVAEVGADGCYTGELSSPWIYGPAKAEAIRKVAAERGYDLRLCYAYSDSSSDLPMLEMVGHPVVVNPDRTLHKIARTRGWPVVEFRNRAVEVTKYGFLGAAAGGGMVGAYYLGRHHGRTRRWPRRG